MKRNAGIKPTPSRIAIRISSPLLVAIVSSSISLVVVVGYFYFFNKKVIIEIGEIDEIIYLSSTPERAAESFFTTLSENEIERALKLCKGSARKAVLDGSFVRLMKQTEERAKRIPGIEETNVRSSTGISIESANKSRKPLESTSKGVTTRFVMDNERSTEKRDSFPKGELLRDELSRSTTHYRPPESLFFSVHESHRKEKNRVLLRGTLQGKETARVHFRNIEVSMENSNSRWYVTRVRIK